MPKLIITKKKKIAASAYDFCQILQIVNLKKRFHINKYYLDFYQHKQY